MAILIFLHRLPPVASSFNHFHTFFGKLCAEKNEFYPKKLLLGSISKSERDLKSIVTILLTEFLNSEGKERTGVKYPLHFSKTDILYNWYPDGIVIFLIRDSRAICASKLFDEASMQRKKKMKFLKFLVHYVTLLFFSFEFIWYARYFSNFRKRSKDRKYYLISYEGLVNEPERVIKEICEFSEIPFENKMLSAFGKPSSFAEESKPGFDKTRVDRWKDKLNNFDKWLITALTKESMLSFGFNKILKL